MFNPQIGAKSGVNNPSVIKAAKTGRGGKRTRKDK